MIKVDFSECFFAFGELFGGYQGVWARELETPFGPGCALLCSLYLQLNSDTANRSLTLAKI